ncbi:Zn-dependent peptidase ImmA (M78 family) [Bradyrhizobium algeriense]|uniref:Zn-dependent peptidase ImmA (M78 family) n=1 Tax=Bradyrhizobium algeriense TaxID=634784 RepID=A0ABU8B8D4_9BRAD
MASSARKKEPIPFNADVLKWAREWRGRSVDEVASKLKQPTQKILDWEDKKSGTAPTVPQARSLAEFYERPFLEFFRSAPPPVKEPELVPDLRRPRDAKRLNAEQERDLRSIQSWAEAQRDNAIDLFSEIGEEPPPLPTELHAAVANNPNTVADEARNALHFDISEQTALRSKQHLLPNVLRNKFGSAGVLTFRRSELKKLGIRGICIFADPLPVIVYGNESPSAQAFTLAHELAHIVLGHSGIIGPVRKNSSPTEKWCDQFAASFLMPQKDVRDVVGAMPNTPADEISDSDLSRYSRHFSVSRHAMLIRLVHLGYVKESFYWNKKKSQFDTEEANFKQFGRAEYYGTRYRNTLGDLYTGLVLQAWTSGRITNHNAAEFMGIKNFSHLNDIREHFWK